MTCLKKTLIKSTVTANCCVMRCSKSSHMSEYAAVSALLFLALYSTQRFTQSLLKCRPQLICHQRYLLVLALTVAQQAWGHLLAPEQMYLRADSANQAFMLYLTPQLQAFASFDTDADGELSAAEVQAQRQQLDEFIDQRLQFSFAGAALQRVFSDLVVSAEPGHGQLTIIRRYVAERALPALHIDYRLLPSSAGKSLRASLRPVAPASSQAFIIAADGKPSQHLLIWNYSGYYFNKYKGLGLAAGSLLLLVLLGWLYWRYRVENFAS